MTAAKNSVSAQKPSEDFFIGWLAMPMAYKKLTRSAAALLVFGAMLVALLAAYSQCSPGKARWQTSEEVMLEGVATAQPYALLRVGDPTKPDETQIVLLVESGKFGAQRRLTPFEGMTIRVRGTTLARSGRTMIELSPSNSAIEVIKPRANSQPISLRSSLGREVRLRGEIVDPKCYLGAMKPGNGKTHKACAALCIAGGVPPMLVTRLENGDEFFYMLLSKSEASAAEQVLPFVGDRVEITAEVSVLGDLGVLQLQSGSIRRL